jgi:hypothetical protein
MNTADVTPEGNASPNVISDDFLSHNTAYGRLEVSGDENLTYIVVNSPFAVGDTDKSACTITSNAGRNSSHAGPATLAVARASSWGDCMIALLYLNVFED